MKIYKYNLKITDEQAIRLPVGSVILSVANQYENLRLWALVDEKSPVLEDRHIEIYGTGHEMREDDFKRRFIGTVILHPYVWHVFEKVAE